MNTRSWIGLSLLLSLGACGGNGGDNPNTPDAAISEDAGMADAAPEPDAIAELPAIGTPEHVLWDAKRRVWYVSNIWGDPTEADGVGWITRLDPNGEVLEAHWVEGLNAPKGMAILDDKLYVADITQIVEIDIATATIDRRIQAVDAQFLNGVAAGGGYVYVTDTLANAIYRVMPGRLSQLYLQDDALKGPNGILVEDDRLVIASFGSFEDFEDLGPLLAVDIQSKAITRIGTLEGKLDGLVADGNRYIVSDFRGQIHTVRFSNDASAQARDTTIEDGLKSAAAVGFDPKRRLVAVPDLLGDQVVLVSLELDRPESALWDANKQVWYVSNIGGPNPAEADGKGWITRFDANGQVLNARWIDGLDAPKGMALVGSNLFVADIDKIVPINIDPDGSGAKLPPISVPGAQFLNDIAAGSDGTLYITDTIGNAIYARAPGQAPVTFVQDEILQGPNGILVEDGRLVVASFGSLEDFDEQGPLYTIDLQSKAIERVGDFTGKFDGLVFILQGAYIASDFRGQIHFLDETGEGFVYRNVASSDDLRSAADIGFDPVGKILAIPDLLGNAIIFLDLSFDLPTLLARRGLR